MDDSSDDLRALALAEALRITAGKLKRRLREEAHQQDLTWSQVSVLAHLDRDGPATVTTLARLEGMRPQSMGATISVLEGRELVAGTPDPGDGRQTLWSLTPACVERISAGRAARQDFLFSAIRTKLTQSEQDDLARTLALIDRLIT